MFTNQPSTNLNPAFFTNAAEFIAYDDQLDCIQAGRRYSYETTPESVKAAVSRHLNSDPIAKKALQDWAKHETIDELRQYTYCLLGGYDNEADVDANGNVNPTEFHNCPLRGSCKYAGKICKSIAVANGSLTRTEGEVLKQMANPDKIIADRMHVSVETILSHQQNIRRKTGYNNKVELAIFATKKGIIQ